MWASFDDTIHKEREVRYHSSPFCLHTTSLLGTPPGCRERPGGRRERPKGWGRWAWVF